ncbi:hypothetical protein IQ265_06960 [Nodosilinea sp. LEGE 06152]|uniref:hypothetical protein n=1 Tax=Nodosilinea sp. LEGE 06152 TaxID=2777966 RepID=UPI001881BF14|nr:hypothetical protein [Nodosilinea sp. LEGE 06152]MBE9156568.1 hypothetical protein [Nodosilinea sp. LEGE 06152]
MRAVWCGITEAATCDRESNERRDWLIDLTNSRAYTAIAASLVYFKILRSPQNWLPN